MIKYIIKRILQAIVILFFVSLILYLLIRCMPAQYIKDKFYAMSGNNSLPEEELYRLLAIYGLEDESFGGIIKGYFGWLGNFLKGDMGVSFQMCAPVSEVIRDTMGISFGISFVALIIELIVAIPLGIKCATNQYGKFDYTVTVLCMALMAFPSFFLGNIFIKVFAVDLGWFEIGGLNSGALQGGSFFVVFGDTLWHLILPVTVMVLLDIGPLMRYTRTNTLEVLNADYIRTARAKGLSEGKVVYKHVFRNTLIPLITLLSSTLPMLFGGAMITETVFAIPGIGQTAYNALKVGDIPLAMGYNMFIAILTVVGVLLADIMYVIVDPRVKLGK